VLETISGNLRNNMKKLKDILKESNIQMGKVYSNPYATAFVKENEEERKKEIELSDEQKQAFLEAVKQYKKYGEAVYRNAGLGEVYESIKNMVEVAGKMTISETGDWFDNVTVSRHMKRMGESFNVFEKTLKEVSTLQQRLEASYDEIGEVLGKYYEISEELDPVGKEDGDIDNDGDEDASDEYLANRRKVISKAMKNESVNEEIKVGSIVTINYPTLKKPIKSKVVRVLNDKNGLLYVMKDGSVWDAKYISTNESMKLTDMIKKPSVNEIKKGSVVIPYAMDKHGEFIVDKVFKNKDGETSYTGKFKKNGEHREFILHSKDRIVKESVNETKFYAFFNNKKHEIEGKDLWDAKQKAITMLKVPKSKVGYLAIVNASEHDKGSFRYESVVNEAKYDIGMARLGNGITVYNRAVEYRGDYKNIAHISDNGTVTYYDKSLPSDVKKKIEAEAQKMKESVNEVASRTAMEIGGLTGMNKDAIQKFVDTNELDIEKVFQFVKKGKLSDRMDLVTAIAGKPNNPIQQKMIKMFGESVNEAKMIVTSIDKIPNIQNLVNQKKVTYKGLGIGKKFNDFYDIAGEGGVIIKVNGKSYYITDSDFKKLGGTQKIKFDAPFRRESVNESKIKMNALDWGKSTAERNANLDKYGSLKTDKEREAFLRKLKGESVNESKKVTKQMWAKMNYDERVDALLTVFKDPDDAEEYADSEWNKLPSRAVSGMTIFESKSMKLTDMIKKPSVN